MVSVQLGNRPIEVTVGSRPVVARFGESTTLAAATAAKLTALLGDARLSLADSAAQGSSAIARTVGGLAVETTVTPFAVPTHTGSQVFNLFEELVDGEVVRNPGDDVSPYWIDNWLLGGNHGHAKTDLTASHDKTRADVGSVWSDPSSDEWVLVDLPGAGLSIVSRGSTQDYLDFGLEQIADGAFAGVLGTAWSEFGGPAWAISGGKAHIDTPGSGSNLYQDAGIVAGATYRVTFDFERSAGQVILFIGDTQTVVNTAGAKALTIVGSGVGGLVLFQANGDFVGSIDNVSVREVPILTHVSGAAHTAAITPTAFAEGQWYPAIRDHAITAFIEGKQVDPSAASRNFGKAVTFVETYSIMRKGPLTDWLETQAGTATDITEYDAPAALSVSLRHAFDGEGGYTLFNEAVALESLPLEYLAPLQGIAPAGDTALRKLYVPKTVAFTADAVAHDWRTPSVVASLPAWTDLTTARADPAFSPPDRLIWLNEADGWGLAMGLLPVLDADPAVREANISNRSIQFSPTLKAYFFGLDGQATLAAGEAHSWVGYKVYFQFPEGGRKAYPVRDPLGDFFYAHWHDTIRDRVPLPSDFHGRAFEVVEKSANVELLGGTTAGGSLLFDVDCSSEPDGFAVLKFARGA